MKPLIIVPSYNESSTLPSLIEKIKKNNYDYIIINDCSTDNTKKLSEKNDYQILNLPINLGIAGVTRVGFMYAYEHEYDCVVCIDGDGQHPPKYIHNLIEEIENGNDYVIGSRFVSKGKPLSFRMMGSRIISFLIKIKTGRTIKDPTSGMRAVGKRVIKDFLNNMNYYAEPDTVCHLLRKKYKIKEIQVNMEERKNGESYFKNPFKSIKYMYMIIISILFIQ